MGRFDTLLISLVRTPDANPNSVSFALLTTPSRSPALNLDTTMTGPNDSSLAMNIQSSASAKMVGTRYKPYLDNNKVYFLKGMTLQLIILTITIIFEIINKKLQNQKINSILC